MKKKILSNETKENLEGFANSAGPVYGNMIPGVSLVYRAWYKHKKIKPVVAAYNEFLEREFKQDDNGKLVRKHKYSDSLNLRIDDLKYDGENRLETFKKYDSMTKKGVVADVLWGVASFLFAPAIWLLVGPGHYRVKSHELADEDVDGFTNDLYMINSMTKEFEAGQASA
jgi:hypothetical protein